MKDLVVRLIGEDKVSATVKQVQHEIDGLKGKSLDDINKKFLRIENSTAPLKAKLKSILALMALMNIDGLDKSPLFDKMAISAGKYKDAIADAQQSIKNLSSDTLGMDATIQGFLAVSGAATAAAGAFYLFGGESEQLLKAQLKIQSLIGIVLGFKAVADALNKDSALMNWMRGFGAVSQTTKVAAQSTKAITAATTADSVALTANTALRLTNERAVAGTNPALALNTKEFGANSAAIQSNMFEILKWQKISKDALADYGDNVQEVMRAQNMFNDAKKEYAEAFVNNLLENSPESALRVIDAADRLRFATDLLNEALRDLNATNERLLNAYDHIDEATKRVTRGEAANTRTVLTNSAATKGATASAKGFSLSLSGIKKQATAAGVALKGLMASIPQMALFMALGIGLTYAIEKLMSMGEASEDTKKKLEALKKKQEELRKKQEDLAGSAAKVKSKYWELLAAWKNLLTQAEKEKWIKDNASEFKNLGLNITSVKTAEDIFVKNTSAVVDALIARAIAAKKAELAAEDLVNLEKRRSSKTISSGDYIQRANDSNITPEERRKHNIPETDTKANGYGGYSIVKHKATLKELDAINRDRALAARKRRLDLKKQYADEEKTIREGVENAVKAEIEANRKLAKLSDPEVTPKTTHSTTKVEPKYNPNANSEKAIHDNITVLQKQLETLDITSNKYRLIADEIDRWKAKLNNIDLANKINKAAVVETYILLKKILDGYLDELEAKEAELAILKRQLDALYEITDANSEDLRKLDGLVAKYKELLKEVEKLRNNSKFEDGSIAALEDLISKIENTLQNTKLDLPARLKLYLRRYEIEQLIKKLTDVYTIPVKILPVKTEDKLGSRENAEANVNLSVQLYQAGIIDRKLLRAEVKAVNDELAKLGLKPIRIEVDADLEGVLTAVDSLTAVKGVADYINGIGESFENCESALDYFSAGLDALIGGLLNYMSIVQMITTLNDLFATSSAAAAAADTAATSVEVANSGSKIAAKSGEAIAGATASGASLPFPLNLVAIAAGIAAVIAALASIGSFANGGIVSSGSLHGDRNLARVNGGEMILNGKLLRRLFNLLNSGGAVRAGGFNGEVEFKISGSALKGVLKNHDNKMSKI